MALVNSSASDRGVSDKKCGDLKRDTKRCKPQRGFIGKMVKYAFIGFNILMLLWFITEICKPAETTAKPNSEAVLAGLYMSAGHGVTMMIIMMWTFGGIAMGIMMLLTAPKE